MQAAKKRKLERAGWRVGTADEFLGGLDRRPCTVDVKLLMAVRCYLDVLRTKELLQKRLKLRRQVKRSRVLLAAAFESEKRYLKMLEQMTGWKRSRVMDRSR